MFENMILLRQSKPTANCVFTNLTISFL